MYRTVPHVHFEDSTVTRAAKWLSGGQHSFASIQGRVPTHRTNPYKRLQEVASATFVPTFLQLSMVHDLSGRFLTSPVIAWFGPEQVQCEGEDPLIVQAQLRHFVFFIFFHFFPLHFFQFAYDFWTSIDFCPLRHRCCVVVSLREALTSSSEALVLGLFRFQDIWSSLATTSFGPRPSACLSGCHSRFLPCPRCRSQLESLKWFNDVQRAYFTWEIVQFSSTALLLWSRSGMKWISDKTVTSEWVAVDRKYFCQILRCRSMP